MTRKTKKIQRKETIDQMLERARSKFLYFIGVGGVLGLTYYLLISPPSSQIFVVSLVILVVDLVNVLVFHLRKNVMTASYVVMGILTFFLLYFIFINQDTLLGLVNLTAIPLVALFLLGKKQGTGFIIGMTILYGLGFAGYFFGLVDLRYGKKIVVDFLINYLVYVVMIYGYQDIQEKAIGLLRTRSTKISEINERLTREVKVRRKAEKNLTKKTSQLKKMNKVMVNRELKMVELKNKLKERDEG